MGDISTKNGELGVREVLVVAREVVYVFDFETYHVFAYHRVTVVKVKKIR